MGTVEFKINGEEIMRITFHNKGPVDKHALDMEWRYTYEIYEFEKPMIRGEIKHIRVEGLLELTSAILVQVLTEPSKKEDVCLCFSSKKEK